MGYNNVLLPFNAIKFHIIIHHFCLLCRPHEGSAMLGKWVCRHPVASTLITSLDWLINASGSVSDFHACVGFHCRKKVEKHGHRLSKVNGYLIFWCNVKNTRCHIYCPHAITSVMVPHVFKQLLARYATARYADNVYLPHNKKHNFTPLAVFNNVLHD